MKSKITRGAGFCGLLDYVFDVGQNATGDKDARQIGGNMAGEINPRALLSEFAALRRLRPDIARPVWHSSLRLPAGEIITDEKWNQIVIDYMTQLGMNPDNHPFIVVTHSDNHIHIVSSRIGFDGSLYYGKNEHLSATRISQQLEKDHGLHVTKGPNYDENGKIVMQDTAKLTSGELKMTERTGDIAVRQRLQEIITAAVKDQPVQARFEKRLTEAGVSFRLSSNGYSYQLDGIAFKGSQLGQAFKWSRLQKALILPEQDIQKRQDNRRQPADEFLHSLSIQQKAIYAAKNAAWQVERKRRDKFRANRSVVYFVGSISARILPRPLGDAVVIAAESMILIARINDWVQAHAYRREVEFLTMRMNQIKAERVKAAKNMAVQQPELKQNIPSSQLPDDMVYYPRQTASIIRILASRTTNTELQAMFNDLVDRVCKLPDHIIVYKGAIDPYSPEFIKTVSCAVYPGRRQEGKILTANAIDFVHPQQIQSQIDPATTHARGGRRR